MKKQKNKAEQQEDHTLARRRLSYNSNHCSSSCPQSTTDPPSDPSSTNSLSSHHPKVTGNSSIIIPYHNSSLFSVRSLSNTSSTLKDKSRLQYTPSGNLSSRNDLISCESPISVSPLAESSPIRRSDLVVLTLHRRRFWLRPRLEILIPTPTPTQMTEQSRLLEDAPRPSKTILIPSQPALSPLTCEFES
jgi:hypothetical protein